MILSNSIPVWQQNFNRVKYYKSRLPLVVITKGLKKDSQLLIGWPIYRGLSISWKRTIAFQCSSFMHISNMAAKAEQYLRLHASICTKRNHTIYLDRDKLTRRLRRQISEHFNGTSSGLEYNFATSAQFHEVNTILTLLL